jgi:hypothetical protein
LSPVREEINEVLILIYVAKCKYFYAAGEELIILSLRLSCPGDTPGYKRPDTDAVVHILLAMGAFLPP